ncbi:Tautomerase/MIF [Biscogniauxia sp. FL1348]|nr:Tautomerase/MIF [Biscogniauxia sp. FL1348]
MPGSSIYTTTITTTTTAAATPTPTPNAAHTSMGRPQPPSAAPNPSRIYTSSPAPGASFAHRKTHPNPNKMMRNIDRPPPADLSSRRKTQVHPEVGRKRSAYFENEFAATNREADPVKVRIHNEAVVLAELKTNIKDEFSFITDLSYHLSNRYQRPISSVAITLNHGSCMMFAGTFEPAYTLTIYALPSLVQPTTNKRNAALIQRHLQESLGVVPARGYIHFVATPEENVAIGGRTVAAEIEESTRGTASPPETEAPRKAARPGRKLSVKSFGTFMSSSQADLVDRVSTPPPSTSGESSRITTIPEVPPTPPDDDRFGALVEQKQSKTASRRKSLRFALFGGKASPEGY